MGPILIVKVDVLCVCMKMTGMDYSGSTMDVWQLLIVEVEFNKRSV